MLNKIAAFLKNIYWIPYEKFNIPTQFSGQVATQMLSKHVNGHPLSKIRFSGSHGNTFFKGAIVRNKFHIRRIIMGRNTFQPSLTGTIEDNGNQSSLIVKVQYHPVVLALLALYSIMILTMFAFFVMAYILVPYFPDAITVSGDFFPMACAFPASLLFIYLIVTTSFSSEVHKTKAFLEELFIPKQ
jgi:hypothetical protein